MVSDSNNCGPRDLSRLRPVATEGGLRVLPYMVLIVMVLVCASVWQRGRPAESFEDIDPDSSVSQILEPLPPGEASPFLERARQLVPNVSCSYNLRWYAFAVYLPRSTGSSALIMAEGREETGKYRYRLYVDSTSKQTSNMVHYACSNIGRRLRRLPPTVQYERELSYLRQVAIGSERDWKREARWFDLTGNAFYRHKVSFSKWRSNLRTATVRTDTASGCIRTVRFRANLP
jgi:hypothetical protein